MKIMTTISAIAMIATAIPAFAQSNTGSQPTARPNGAPGSTSGTDAKGGMIEGRGSVSDENGYSGGARRHGGNGGGYNNGASGYDNGNMAPGGGPGVHD